ncbi:MAG: NAD-dependent epimerase/dehydratase family protein [Cyanobacteriota bacterium]
MKVFVTGGAGFLGKAIIKQLLKENHEIISYSRNNYPELERMGVTHSKGDLSDLATLKKAIKGCDVVFHVAAKASYWGDYQDFYSTNVLGTENIIQACKDENISKLIYTSSPSVVHNGVGIEGKNEEQLPYPEHFEAYYPQTKAIAEKKILEANSDTLATVALRPHLIWGPEDPHFFTRINKRARAGKLFLIGDNNPLVDCVYIDNAASAHLLAMKKLDIRSSIAGKAYFITQDKQIGINDFINMHVKAGGLPEVNKKIPAGLAYFVGTVFETFYKFFDIKSEPRLTLFLAKQLSTPHWFDISAAKRDLGYVPEISTEEGYKRLKEWADNQHI